MQASGQEMCRSPIGSADATLEKSHGEQTPKEGSATLEMSHGGQTPKEAAEKKYRKWKKVLDAKEAKGQVLFALPMSLCNVSYYCIPLVSVMFAGHLGELQLAGATLANSWVSVTGFTFMVGLSGALETLCGQAFGAALHRMLGIYLQASCITSFFFCVIVSIIWIYTEPLLVLLHQDPEISKVAALYMKCLIPGLFAYGFLNNILRFLQTQSIVVPLVVCSLIPLIIHMGLAYALVHWTSLGFKGAPFAASISMWISVFMLAAYVLCTKKFEHTWTGFSTKSFRYVIPILKIALPSATMVCLEYWAFEIMVFLAGLMPNSKRSTSVIAMCVNTETCAYMFFYGLSAATSTRVANELGANNPGQAKKAVIVSSKLAVVPTFVIVLSLALGHNIWAGFFSDSHEIIEYYASMAPLLVISIVLDSAQAILSGVTRGCGWQHLAVYINLGSYYLVGLPLACLLGFKLKLYARGLWIGSGTGLLCQVVALALIALCSKWTRLELPGKNVEEIPVPV